MTALGANGLEIIKTLTSEEISLLLKFDGGPSASCHSHVNHNSDNERNYYPSNPTTNQSEFFLKDVVDYGGAGIEGGLGLPSQSDILSLTPLANMLAIPTHEAEIASMPILSNQYILSLLDGVLSESSVNHNSDNERNYYPSNPTTNQSEFFLKDVVDYGGAGIEGGLGLPSQSDILSLTPLANMLAIPTHEAEIATMPGPSTQYILSLLDGVLSESSVNHNSDNERNYYPSNPTTNQSEFFLKDVVDYGGAGIEGGSLRDLGLPSQSDILSLTPLANMLAIPTHEAEIASMPILSNQYILSLLDEVLNETSANKNNNVEETSGCLQEEPGPHNSNNEASISESEQSTSKDGVIKDPLLPGRKRVEKPSAFYRSWRKVLGTKYEELLLGGWGDFFFEYRSPIDYKSSSSLGKYFDKQLPRQDIFIKRFLSMQKLILDIRNENGHSQQEGLLTKIAVNLIAIRRIGFMMCSFIQMLPLVEYKRSDLLKIRRNLGESITTRRCSLGSSLRQINDYLIDPSSAELWNYCVGRAKPILVALFDEKSKGGTPIKSKMLQLSELGQKSVKKFMDNIQSLEVLDEEYTNKLDLFQKKIVEIENLIKELSDNCFNELTRQLGELQEMPRQNLYKVTQVKRASGGSEERGELEWAISSESSETIQLQVFGGEYEKILCNKQVYRHLPYRHPINYQSLESLGAYFDKQSSSQDYIVGGLLRVQELILKPRDKSVHNQHEILIKKIKENLSIIHHIALKAQEFILILPPVKYECQTDSSKVYKDIVIAITSDRRALCISLEGLNSYLNNPTAERWNYCVGRAELTLAALFDNKSNFTSIKFKLLKLSELGQKSVKKFMDNIQSLETSDEEYINKLYLFRKKNAEIENLIKELSDNCFEELAQQLGELQEMPAPNLDEVTQVKRTSGGIEKRRELEGAISSESREATQLQEILSPNLDEVNQVKRIRGNAPFASRAIFTK